MDGQFVNIICEFFFIFQQLQVLTFQSTHSKLLIFFTHSKDISNAPTPQANYRWGLHRWEKNLFPSFNEIIESVS